MESLCAGWIIEVREQRTHFVDNDHQSTAGALISTNHSKTTWRRLSHNLIMEWLSCPGSLPCCCFPAAVPCCSVRQILGGCQTAKNDWILDFQVSMELSHWYASGGVNFFFLLFFLFGEHRKGGAGPPYFLVQYIFIYFLQFIQCKSSVGKSQKHIKGPTLFIADIYLIQLIYTIFIVPYCSYI